MRPNGRLCRRLVVRLISVRRLLNSTVQLEENMKIDRFTKLLLAVTALLLAINLAIHIPFTGGTTQASAPAFLQAGKTVYLNQSPVQILKVDPSGWVLVKSGPYNKTSWKNSNLWGEITENP